MTRCGDIAHLLPKVLDNDPHADSAAVAHVSTCLRCQAELARYRRLMRLLHQMREMAPPPPPGLVSELMAGLETAARRGVVTSALTGRRTGVLAATGLVGASVLWMMVSMRRSGHGAILARFGGGGLGRGRFVVLSSTVSPQGQ
ncbi:MAG: anti-sigma factor family protein [Acidimicrobiales bacterium]